MLHRAAAEKFEAKHRQDEPTVTSDSSFQEQATRESHHKTTTHSTWKRIPGHRGEGSKF